MTKLNKLKVAFEVATPGEWHRKSWHEGAVLDRGGRMVAAAYTPDDARAITLAHNLMPALLEAVDLLETLRYSMSQYDDGEWFLHEGSDELIANVDDFMEKLK